MPSTATCLLCSITLRKVDDVHARAVKREAALYEQYHKPEVPFWVLTESDRQAAAAAAARGGAVVVC